MNYLNLDLHQLLSEIDNKKNAIINLGEQLHKISNDLEGFLNIF